MATSTHRASSIGSPHPLPPEQVEWSPEQIDAISSETPWFPLSEELEALVVHLPDSALLFERTTVLTWAYQMNGLIGFKQIWERLTGYKDRRSARKKAISVLNVMTAHELLRAVHFSAEGPGRSEEGINEASAFELTTRGMIWLANAWTARRNLAKSVSVLEAHRILSEEEDDSKKFPLHYVAPVQHGTKPAKKKVAPRGNFVFSLVQPEPAKKARAG